MKKEKNMVYNEEWGIEPRTVPKRSHPISHLRKCEAAGVTGSNEIEPSRGYNYNFNSATVKLF